MTAWEGEAPAEPLRITPPFTGPDLCVTRSQRLTCLGGFDGKDCHKTVNVLFVGVAGKFGNIGASASVFENHAPVEPAPVRQFVEGKMSLKQWRT